MRFGLRLTNAFIADGGAAVNLSLAGGRAEGVTAMQFGRAGR